jgi:hypothetical protein
VKYNTNTVSGRCKPCGVVYQWNARPGMRRRDAWCPRCKRRLTGTAVSLVTNPNIVDELPLFGKYEPR